MRGISLIIVMFGLSGLALAAPKSAPTPTPRPDPCATADARQGADYVPGVDAEGRAVPRADIGAAPVPVPDTVYVPLRGAGRGPAGRGRGGPPYAAIDGKRLDPLLNPPACPR